MFGTKEKLKQKTCIICNSQTHLFSKKNGHEVYKCNFCGLGFTTNLGEQKGDYHRDSEYLSEEKLFKNIFLKRVRVITKFTNTGKVLEVGCSNGLMLSLLKDVGWKVKGVEISKAAAKIAEERGVIVIRQPFEKVNFKERFDLIIFNHTLEHIKDPLGALEKAKRLLKLKGTLYIDLPNFDSLSANLFKGSWSLLLPSEHLWHFTEKSFVELFQKLGFGIIYVEKTSGIWDVEDPKNELFLSLINLKKRFFSQLLSTIPSLIISKLNLGSDLMVIARKK